VLREYWPRLLSRAACARWTVYALVVVFSLTYVTTVSTFTHDGIDGHHDCGLP